MTDRPADQPTDGHWEVTLLIIKHNYRCAHGVRDLKTLTGRENFNRTEKGWDRKRIGNG